MAIIFVDSNDNRQLIADRTLALKSKVQKRIAGRSEISNGFQI